MKIATSCLSMIAASILLATCASAQSPWSPERYRSADGWVWNPSTGMWRNPKPTFDRNTRQWVHQERHPSSTGCCDRTGLSFPAGAVNSFESYDRPARPARAHRRQEAPGAPSARADAVDPIEDGVARIQRSNLDQERKDLATAHLRASRRGAGRGAAPAAVEAESEAASSGAAANLYGRIGGLNADSLETLARDRRRNPANDPGVLDIVSGGLGAGLAIGRGISAGRAGSTPSNRMGSYEHNREAFRLQQRRPPPSPVPRGNVYNPNLSGISGIR